MAKGFTGVWLILGCLLSCYTVDGGIGCLVREDLDWFFFYDTPVMDRDVRREYQSVVLVLEGEL